MATREWWSPEVVADAVRLLEAGIPAREVAARSGVGVGTVRAWERGAVPAAARHVLAGGRLCSECRQPEHDPIAAPRGALAYLLGAYLGDGCLSRQTRTWSLRVTLDAAYPGVIGEVADATRVVRGRPPNIARPKGENYVIVTSYWASWPCWMLPYEPGKKHERPIVLARWQRELVTAEPGPFLRGLIHTDGWRGENRVRSKGRWYSYPRYQFSNRSDDIRRLFTDACNELGIAWRPWGRFHISVARREAVAALDEHVGPKA